MIRKIGLALLTVCFMAAPALAEKVYIVAADCTWPPMEMLDANKQIIGYGPDYIRAVAKEAGIQIEIRNTAWDGIFAALGNNQADIVNSSVTITPERLKTLDFSDSYFTCYQTVVVRANSNIAKMSDLSGKKVGGQIGTTGIIQTMKKAQKSGVAKKVQIKTYDEVGLAFEDLVKGVLDAVICDSPVATNYAYQKSEYAGKMKAAFSNTSKSEAEDFGFAIRKGDKDLQAKLNKGIKAVKAKGIEAQLLAKWNIK